MPARHIMDLTDLSVPECLNILRLAADIREHPDNYTDRCRGKILATLFYEPSTRTQMSFQTAMLRLGGQIIGFDNPQNSSVAKGETLKDTIRVISGYADVIAMRHPLAGSAAAAAQYSRVPVINAGDGGHLHPTQTLADLATLQQEKGTLSGLVVGICGDLKNGRTVHSLIRSLIRFPNNAFVLISTPHLRIPAYIRETLAAAGCPFREVDSLAEAMPQLDVLYMTRIQRERFVSQMDYEKQAGIYVLDGPKMALAKPDLAVLHPLPRVDEIAQEVDGDDRAKYFKQTEYGLYARMALIMKLAELPRDNPPLTLAGDDRLCANEHCITRSETYLPRRFRPIGEELLECVYCDERFSPR